MIYAPCMKLNYHYGWSCLYPYDQKLNLNILFSLTGIFSAALNSTQPKYAVQSVGTTFRLVNIHEHIL